MPHVKFGQSASGASAMPGGSSGGGGGDEVVVGFAKLQGEDFVYYMKTYSIMLGRNSMTSTVDVDISSLGGGKKISRHHARIFYDFQHHHFALDVIGMNGCRVQGDLHLPGNLPIKLASQYLLQIGSKKFYFLLPTRSISMSSIIAARRASIIPPQLSQPSSTQPGHQEVEEIRHGVSEIDVRGESIRRNKNSSRDLDICGGQQINVGAIGTQGEGGSSSEIRSSGDKDVDNQQALQAEEKDVVSAVATVLSDLCGPGEWVPMAKFNTELLEHFGNVWHPSRVRKYLASETKGRPWDGLLALLRKYPDHFVINTRSEGRVTSEFVSLVSLLS